MCLLWFGLFCLSLNQNILKSNRQRARKIVQFFQKLRELPYCIFSYQLQMNQWSHCNELSNEIVFLHMEKWRKSAKVWSILFLWPLDEARETFIYLYIYLLTCSWINFLLSVKYTYLINLQVSQVKCTWWVYYQWFLILISSSGGTV